MSSLSFSLSVSLSLSLSVSLSSSFSLSLFLFLSFFLSLSLSLSLYNQTIPSYRPSLYVRYTYRMRRICKTFFPRGLESLKLVKFRIRENESSLHYC